MLKFPLPPIDRFSGDQLRGELERAGYRNVIVGQHGHDELWIEGSTNGHPLDERSRPKVEAIVAAHEYRPLEAQVAALQEQVAALTAWKAEVEKHPALKVLR